MQRQLLLVCLIALISCSRPSPGTDRLVIALNPVECVSCIKNMQLLLKSSAPPPITFVFEEKYKKEAAEIIQSMSLDAYHGTYVWSDSLFDRNSIYGISAISLISGDGDVILKKQLKIVTQQDINRILGHQKPVTDTLALPAEIASHAYETIFADNNRLYFCDSRKKRIDIMGLAGGNYLKTLQVGQSDVKAAFDTVLGKGAYELNKRELTRLKDPKQESLLYYCLSDSCLVTVAAYTCLAAINQGDTVVAGFYAVHTFRDEAKSTTVFPDIPFIPQTFRRDGKDLLSCDPAVHYYNGAYFGNIRKSDTAKGLRGNRFLAKFHPAGGRLRYVKVFDYQMPDVYINGNNAQPLFYKGYCMLPLGNRIYSLDEQAPIEIKGLTFKVSLDFFTPPDKYLVEFKVLGDQVTLVYHVLEKRQYHLLRYDLKKEKIIFDKVIPSAHQKPVIDWNDNDYVYYQVPGDKMVRQHQSYF